MRVLVIGGGGREQAIAWACRHHGHDVRIATELGHASGDDTDLVIPGPEAALVAGVADECARRNIACFGPTAELAQLESSKTYARELATALGIPGPRFASFDDAGAAIAWWRELDRPVVVKLDGLAAGKGVTVPEGEAATIEAIRSVSGPFLLEERLRGPECSLLALCDGVRAVALPLAQDHKRLGEGDTGPNTGGMGAYAPAPVPYDAGNLVAEFVQPVLDHFAAAGTPYVGVIFAGLMLTSDGPRLIEYNVRLGDPEAQGSSPWSRPTSPNWPCWPPGASSTSCRSSCAPKLPSRSWLLRPATQALRWRARPSATTWSAARSGPTAPAPCASMPGSTPTAASRVDVSSRSPGSASTSPRLGRRRTTTSTESTSTGCRCVATSGGGRSAPS